MALTHVKKQFFPYNGVAATTITFQYAMGNGAAGTGRKVHFFLRGDQPDTATYNGVPLATIDSDTSPFCRLYISEDSTLPADTSDHDLVFTYPAGRTNQGVLVSEWSGAKQLGAVPPGAVLSSAAGATHPVTFNTTVDGVTVECFYLRIEDRTMSAQPAGTVLHSDDAGVVYDGQRIIAATGPTPAGAATFTFDSSGNSNGAAAAVQLEEEVVAGDVDGTAAWSIPAIGFAASGAIPVAADLALAVPAPSFAATGEVPIAGALALTVPAPSFEASGEVPVAGALALAVPAPAFQAATVGQVEGAAGLSIPAISLAASGDVGVRGALLLSLPAIAMSMAGTVHDFSAKIITGRMLLRAAITGDVALRTAITGQVQMRQHITGRTALHPFVPVPGTPPTPGTGAIFGVLTLTNPAPSFTAAGTVGAALPIEGVAALTIPAISLSATGEISEGPLTGAAALTVPAIGFSAAGEVTTPTITPLLHTFTGADDPSTVGTADSGHTPIVLAGTWGRIGGKAYCPSGVGNDAVVFDVGAADGIAAVVFTTISHTGARLVVRATDANNYLLLIAAGSLFRRQAGANTFLGNGPAFVSGDSVSIELSGSSVVVKKNGALLFSVTEAFNQTATRHGIGNGSATASANRWDSLSFTP